MGTNYFARIIPSEPKKKELKIAIDSNDFSKVKSLESEMYGRFTPYNMTDIPTGEVHLGKRSGGWKFLWNPNTYVIRNGHTEEEVIEPGHSVIHFIPDPNTLYYLYPLTKEGIKSFIDRKDIEIYNEYDEKEDKEEFFKMALDWTTWEDKEAWDSDSYEKEYPSNYIHKSELTEMLELEGYKLSKSKSDFYSDGLRFSTSNDFC